MRASELDRLMTAALDGEATPDEAAALERALADDPVLRERYAAWQRLFDALARVPAPHPPEGLVAAVMANIPAAGRPADDQLTSPSPIFGVGSNPFSLGGTMSEQTSGSFNKRKLVIGVGLAAIAVVVIAGYSLDMSPASKDAVGTIAPAERFVKPQATAVDVPQGAPRPSGTPLVPPSADAAAGQAKGSTLGQTQGSTLGQTQGSTLGQTQGSTLGQTQGSTLGQTQGSTLGQTQGSTLGQTQGSTLGQTQGSTLGQTQGQAKGQTQGSTLGQTQGQAKGQTQGSTLGQTQGSTLGQTQGQTQGQAKGQTQGSTLGQTLGQTQGQAKGQTQGSTLGQTQGTTLGQTQGSTLGQTQGQTQGKALGTTQ
jgi:hypothetical protein